jgi:SecD/SecF fusion protein
LKPQQTSLLIALLTVAAIVAAVLVKPKFGLDIRGGARVVLEADVSKLPQGRKWDQETRQAVLQTVENRVNANGVSEPVITSKGDRQFVVEIPSIRNEEEVLEQLQTTAQLQFYYSTDWVTNRNQLGRYQVNRAAASGNRELYQITDNNTKQTFRDLFQINQELRSLLDKGKDAGDKAKQVPLPAPLPDLSSARGSTTVPVAEGDEKRLAELAEETRAFNAFIGAARLELDGSDILPTARSGFDTSGQGAVVELEFNDRGRQKFANFTRDHTNDILMIYLDGRILTAPNITEPILNGRAQINGFATLKEAKGIADLLNGGSLPVPLKIVQLQSVEATLGNSAVQQSFIAGLIGLGLVAAFMIGYYKVPGVVAVVALLLYTLFSYAIFVLVPVTFTLPGIAGFILSIGMAVDANILIFERTKEELRAGKNVRQAVEAGFSRAFSAILDSNVCTAVTSVLLYYLGTGAVRGFALTLLIGVGVSMFTAITVSRTFLLLLNNSGMAKDAAAWGVDRQINPRLNVVGRRGLWYGISVAMIVPGLVLGLMGGFKPGIDFTGGSELALKFPPGASVNRLAIEKAVAAQGIEDPAAQIAGGNTVFVRLPKQKGKGEVTVQEADKIVANLQSAFPGVTKEGFETIGSSISSELTRNALTSVLYSSVFIALYLAFRFGVGGFRNGVKFGVGAIIAMLHDVFVLIGMFCILGYFLNWKVDSLFVTAALTVIGFSVHDTVVIFDRIRENLRLRSKGDPFADIVNDSINETFARSVFTSMTVMITLLALAIFGGAVIRPLNVALLIGILSGTYSSIFNAAPLVVDWQRLFGGGTAPERRSGTATPSAPKPATGATPTAKAADRPTPAGGFATGRPASSTDTPTGNGTTTDKQSTTSRPPIASAAKPRRRRM